MAPRRLLIHVGLMNKVVDNLLNQVPKKKFESCINISNLNDLISLYG